MFEIINHDPCNLKLPDPSLVIYYKNIEDRKIWIDMDIDAILIDFEKYILQWNAEDAGKPVEERKPIRLFIYSYGGDLDATNSFIDVIKMSKTPIHTINMGQALSAGALIFLSGHKRFVMPKSQILIHQGSIGGISGTTNQVLEMTDNLKKVETKLKEYIIEHSKIDEKLYKKKQKTEWYLSAEEALELGVADAIVSNIEELF
jgi:ATP-dependent Clp protease protease subunit